MAVTIRVPFGKHKGALLTNLPDDYLEWLFRTPDDGGPSADFVKRNKIFFEHARAERLRRIKGEPLAQVGPRGIPGKRFLVELVDAGYKALALRYHPDKGGRVEDMQELNKLRDHLKSL